MGYYHANERVNDATISDTAVTIANKIAVNCDKACLLIVSHELELTCIICVGVTVGSRYSGSLKYVHLDIPAIWFGTDC